MDDDRRGNGEYLEELNPDPPLVGPKTKLARKPTADELFSRWESANGLTEPGSNRDWKLYSAFMAGIQAAKEL